MLNEMKSAEQIIPFDSLWYFVHQEINQISIK